MAIDNGDYHLESAGTWSRACRHIVLYLLWAAERGLVSDEIDTKALRKSPVKYFSDHCDGKLWDQDFNAEGRAVAKAIYAKYLNTVTARARELGITDYEIPRNKATDAHFFPVLDQLRAKAARRPRAKAKGKRRSAPRSNATRRFELVEGASKKFWSIALVGSSVTTTWGQIGSEGQSKTKSLGSPNAAQDEYEKLVREKTRKGYVEAYR